MAMRLYDHEADMNFITQSLRKRNASDWQWKVSLSSKFHNYENL